MVNGEQEEKVKQSKSTIVMRVILILMALLLFTFGGLALLANSTGSSQEGDATSVPEYDLYKNY